MSNISTLLEDGLIVTVIGISVVFLFLIILVFTMHITSHVVAWLNKLFPVIDTSNAAPISKDKNEEIAIAIVMAMRN